MLTSGTHSATPIGSSALVPLSGTTPVDFVIPNIGSHVHGDRITLVLTGEPDASNNTAGLRCSRNAATLSLPLAPITPVSPWTSWQQQKFGLESTNESVAGFAADPDDDGILNLMEYALGGDPLLSETGILPKIRCSNNSVEFFFKRNPNHSDLRMTVQAASDLNVPWTDAAVSTGGAAFVALIPSVSQSEDNGVPERLVSIVEDVAELTRRFMRLRVELLIP